MTVYVLMNGYDGQTFVVGVFTEKPVPGYAEWVEEFYLEGVE